MKSYPFADLIVFKAFIVSPLIIVLVLLLSLEQGL